MPLSLRTRLTVWYSALLLFAVVLFSATVLWLHWRFVLAQSDESLRQLCSVSANVVAEELREGAPLPRAAHEAESVVRNPDYALGVVSGAGDVVVDTAAGVHLTTSNAVNGRGTGTVTVDGSDGKPWRVTFRRGSEKGVSFTVAIATPMTEVLEQWYALLKACAAGIPFVLAVAIAGGWTLGRRGLQPLADMEAQARAITARTTDTRLAVPRAGRELAAVAVSFNRVLDRLGTAIETQRRFMADASHELRTPVSTMRTAADVTLSQPSRDEPEYRDALTVVSQQAVRLARMVDDMLVLARSDAGGYPLSRAEFDLDAVVADCVRELAPLALARGVRLTAAPRPITVVGDEALVQRMLSNLITNAVLYTSTGGSVHVKMAPGDEVVGIEVADTGRGIPEEDRERIFERFVRLDPARGDGGAGLGLAIARWIAEAHGGRVDLVTTGAGGSVFAASLPRSFS